MGSGLSQVDMPTCGIMRPMLRVFGIDPDVELTYRTLLAEDVGTVEQLSIATGLDPDRQRAALSCLVSDGLAVDGGELPTPVAPSTALRSVLQRRRADLDQAELSLELLAGRLAADSGGGLPATSIEVITGGPAIARRVQEMVATTREELLLFDAPPYAVPGNSDGDGGLDVTSAVRRGASVKVLFAQEGLDLPGRMRSITTLVENGVQTRVLGQLPTKLLIRDRNQALLPPSNAADATERALVVHDVLLSNVLVPMFERAWRDAVPMGITTAEHGPDLDERRLLAMLASGMKDEAIARQTGVHVRTIRRRISMLLARLDATTRFQAGAQAARRDWLHLGPSDASGGHGEIPFAGPVPPPAPPPAPGDRP